MFIESDPIGLLGGSWSTYTYVGGNPISRRDSTGLAAEEDDPLEEERLLLEDVTKLDIESLFNDIRAYDPNFNYSTVAPRGYTYGPQDIETLKEILRQYRTQENSACMVRPRLSYGRTPRGLPFSRHYGAETGPVRNIPPSLIDSILNNVAPIPSRNGTHEYFDPVNNVTVVTGANGLVSAHKGPP